jgi:hypothetical protein
MPDNKFKNTDTRPNNIEYLWLFHSTMFTRELLSVTLECIYCHVYITAAVVRKTHTVCIRTVTKLGLYDNHDSYNVVESIAEDYV